MSNIIDYAESELNTFQKKAFNPIDSLVLAQFSYIHFDNIMKVLQKEKNDVMIKDLFKAEYFDKMLLEVRDNVSNQKLLMALAASPRFRDIKISDYINKVDSQLEKQFSATTFYIDADTAYVAFRGTDSTIVGWKEDFNMSFEMPVPSQVEAVEYLNAVGKDFNGKIIVGGHSKGGNLAVYATMYCQDFINKQIIQVYCHDGPGFQEEVFQSIAYQNIVERLHKTLPQSSTVGMLLEYQDNYSVVKSNEFWFMQHDPFSWQVAKDDFIYEEHITQTAKYTNTTINQWLQSATPKERELFIDTLYSVINKTNITRVDQFKDNIIQDSKTIINALNDVDDQTKRFVYQTLKELVSLSFKNLIPPKKINNKLKNGRK